MKKWISMAAALALATPSLSALAGTEMTLDQLPDQVRQTVEREVAGGKINEIEREEKDGRVHYEVEFSHNDKDWQLKVGSDGKLIERKRD